MLGIVTRDKHLTFVCMQLREAPALDVQLRLDHDQRLKVATDEQV